MRGRGRKRRKGGQEKVGMKRDESNRYKDKGTVRRGGTVTEWIVKDGEKSDDRREKTGMEWTGRTEDTHETGKRERRESKRWNGKGKEGTVRE